MLPIQHYAALLRPQQWYKNLVVFLALFFSGNMLSVPLLRTTLWAFAALCFISSSGYIINDLWDRKYDAVNPEKRQRPVAAGNVNLIAAGLLSAILLAAGLLVSFRLGDEFGYLAASLFMLTVVYTFFLKNIIVADVLAISSLFVLRALAGALAIHVRISPWLVLVPFFLSLFLSVGKRQGEVQLLGEKAASAREVLQGYTANFTNALMVIATTLLVMSYALYSFLSEHKGLLYTLPLALFVIVRYYYLISCGSEIARHPEKVIKDVPMIVGMLLWLLVTGWMIYG